MGRKSSRLFIESIILDATTSELTKRCCNGSGVVVRSKANNGDCAGAGVCCGVMGRELLVACPGLSFGVEGSDSLRTKLIGRFIRFEMNSIVCGGEFYSSNA